MSDTRPSGVVGYSLDLTTASSILSALVTCDSRTSPFGFNPSFHCNPALDRQITNALEHQTTDPASAPALWAAIDRAVVNAAPIIPFSNDVQYDFGSRRIGDYQNHTWWGQLPAQR